MKKHWLKVFVIAVVVLLLIIVFVIFKLNEGTRPFKNLSVDEIEKISVTLYPPDKTFEVEPDEVEHVVELLQEIVVYEEDNSYEEYNGQAVIFSLTDKDGSVKHINIYTPFVIVDGNGYQAKYKPCDALCAYANSLMEK